MLMHPQSFRYFLHVGLCLGLGMLWEFALIGVFLRPSLGDIRVMCVHVRTLGCALEWHYFTSPRAVQASTCMVPTPVRKTFVSGYVNVPVYVFPPTLIVTVPVTSFATQCAPERTTGSGGMLQTMVPLGAGVGASAFKSKTSNAMLRAAATPYKLRTILAINTAPFRQRGPARTSPSFGRCQPGRR